MIGKSEGINSLEHLIVEIVAFPLTQKEKVRVVWGHHAESYVFICVLSKHQGICVYRLYRYTYMVHFYVKKNMDGFEHEVAGMTIWFLQLQLKSILSQRDSFRINAASPAPNGPLDIPNGGHLTLGNSKSPQDSLKFLPSKAFQNGTQHTSQNGVECVLGMLPPTCNRHQDDSFRRKYPRFNLSFPRIPG